MALTQGTCQPVAEPLGEVGCSQGVLTCSEGWGTGEPFHGAERVGAQLGNKGGGSRLRQAQPGALGQVPQISEPLSPHCKVEAT